jgi:glyoxylase-like metal-dependent hydrolase (beta-lactamase superfamily II)
MSRITKTKIGATQVISLTDGETKFGAELFPGTDEAEIAALLKKAGKSAVETNFNAFVIKSGSDVMLVDAGPRDLFGPTCGNLGEAMSEADVAAEDITHLFFTHLHPDHIAGALTKEGQPVFEKAQMLLSEADYKFWNDSTFTDETLLQWQNLAKVAITAYKGKTERVKDGETLIKGTTAMALPGHTPGHMGLRIDDGSESFVHVGDIAHAQHLQLANPEIAIAFDIDADTARKTRKRTLDMVATDGMKFSGGHILRPTIGVLKRDGKGYVYAKG